MKLEGEAGRDVIRYIKQEGAPSIELCPRERLVSEATGQVDACERACAPAYRNSPLERVPYRSGDAPIKSRKPHSTRFACYDRPFQGQFPSRKFLHLNWSLREWENSVRRNGENWGARRRCGKKEIRGMNICWIYLKIRFCSFLRILKYFYPSGEPEIVFGSWPKLETKLLSRNILQRVYKYIGRNSPIESAPFMQITDSRC